MKSRHPGIAHMLKGRAPRGARGLKCRAVVGLCGKHMSRPTRGAWIEIRGSDGFRRSELVAPHEGRVD